ncbi:unnamed protein product [Prunus armeniaca]
MVVSASASFVFVSLSHHFTRGQHSSVSSSAIDVVDPSWELYVLIQRKTDQQGEIYNMLLYIYQLLVMHALEKQLGASILVLPPYQHKGCGRYLLEVLNDVAISENVYDLTVDEPLDYFEHVRTCTMYCAFISSIQSSMQSAQQFRN